MLVIRHLLALFLVSTFITLISFRVFGITGVFISLGLFFNSVAAYYIIRKGYRAYIAVAVIGTMYLLIGLSLPVFTIAAEEGPDLHAAAVKNSAKDEIERPTLPPPESTSEKSPPPRGTPPDKPPPTTKAKPTCREFVETLSAKRWAKEYGQSEAWVIANHRTNLWERKDCGWDDTCNGKSSDRGNASGKLLPGSRALILEKNGKAFRVESPLDGSSGWIGPYQVTRTVWLTPEFQPCKKPK